MDTQRPAALSFFPAARTQRGCPRGNTRESRAALPRDAQAGLGPTPPPEVLVGKGGVPFGPVVLCTGLSLPQGTSGHV